jgi:hypothetical protein
VVQTAVKKVTLALFCSCLQIQYLYAALASSDSLGKQHSAAGGAVASWRAALAALKSDYEKSGRYTGKV